jgi:hypothetical protein
MTSCLHLDLQHRAARSGDYTLTTLGWPTAVQQYNNDYASTHGGGAAVTTTSLAASATLSERTPGIITVKI